MNRDEVIEKIRTRCADEDISARQAWREMYGLMDRLSINTYTDPLIVKANERLALAHEKGVRYPYPFADVAPWTPRGAWFMREYRKAMNRKRDRKR